MKGSIPDLKQEELYYKAKTKVLIRCADMRLCLHKAVADLERVWVVRYRTTLWDQREREREREREKEREQPEPEKVLVPLMK